MISVLINWLYAFITMYILGRFVLKRLYKFFKYESVVTTAPAVVTGIVITTAYAGYFSLFHKVGVAANVVMIIVCILFFCVDREEYIIETKKLKSAKPWQYIVFTIIVFVTAFFTMEGELFWDTGLYHCQTIRWIEEYGVVKGLVHVVKRLGYNSTFYCQCALYSFKDIAGQSLHALAGFYSLLMMLYATFGINRKPGTEDDEVSRAKWRGLYAVRLFPFIYFILICSEIVSPASDYPLVNLIIFVTLRWFHNLANKEKSETPYSLLCVLIAFIVSVKLSVGALVLLVVAPAFWLIKRKKVRDIIAYLILGIVVSAPYFIREVIISGWLIYPFTGIDLFNFDWKMAAKSVDADANEMLVWCRGTEGNGSPDDSIRVWFKSWWDYIYLPQQQIIVAAAISAGTAILVAIYRVIRVIIDTVTKKLKLVEALVKYSLEYTYIEFVIIACLTFWMVKGPGIRYGFGYLITMSVVMFADIIAHINKKPITWLNGAIIVACLVFWIPSLKSYFVWNYECIRYRMEFKNFVMQEDYPIVPFKTAVIDDKLEVYYPEEEMGQIWYDMFPGVWCGDVDGIEMRGDKIEDGFRDRNN